MSCNRVSYKEYGYSSLMLQVPADATGKVIDGKKEYIPIKLQDSLRLFFQNDFRELTCSFDAAKTQASFTQRFKTYPQFLFCTMSRFVLGENWVLEKINVDIDAPEILDLDNLRGTGLQAGEMELPQGIFYLIKTKPNLPK